MKSLRAGIICFIAMLAAVSATAQQGQEFTRADTLRGTITPQRAWWEVVHYDLNVTVQPEDSSVTGFNRITYRAVDTPRHMQIDLQEPLEVDRMVQNGQSLTWFREGIALFVEMPVDIIQDSLHTITVYYRGNPRVAVNAPWDGGFVWAQDSLGIPWIATANQGLGASVWWPNKDHQTAEPDSMRISITVPDPLVNVSNGRLTEIVPHDNGMTTFTWEVRSPINNYNVAVNAGNYANFRELYEGENGTLDLSYWVLEHNLEKAQRQFQEVKPMLQCFEHWFGPYPFYEDSFKLVETPHLGMEHQSAVAYGNEYQMGYAGTDLSGTGWGLEFDFIIIHEAGHEWWGNSVTTEDIADMWIHEGFTNYSENLYVECRWGQEAGAAYVIGTRSRIQNQQPVIGTYGVNSEGSGDMYYKGGNLLHMVRQIIDDDEHWRQILRGIQSEYYHSNTTSAEVENYIDERVEADLQPVFDQYLRYTDIPTLEYRIENGTLSYRWRADVEGFDMPVEVQTGEGQWTRIQPVTGEWRRVDVSLEDPEDFTVNRNWYVNVERVEE